MAKSPDAFRTISEVADWLGIQAHVLRFWESKFTQVKPIKRAGGRRYYRPGDMLLLGGIKKLLHDDGLTIKGVQKILREEGMNHVAAMSAPLDEMTMSQIDAAPMPEPIAPTQPEKAVVLSFGDAAERNAQAAAEPVADIEETVETSEPLMPDAAVKPDAPDLDPEADASPPPVISPVPPQEPAPNEEATLAHSEERTGAGPNGTEAPSPIDKWPEPAGQETDAGEAYEPNMQDTSSPRPAITPVAPDEPAKTTDASQTLPEDSSAVAPKATKAVAPTDEMQIHQTDAGTEAMDAEDASSPDTQQYDDQPSTDADPASQPAERSPLPAFLRSPLGDAAATPPATDNPPATDAEPAAEGDSPDAEAPSKPTIKIEETPVTTSEPPAPKPRVLADIQFMNEADIPATPSVLSGTCSLRHLDRTTANQIKPLLVQLGALRDSMAARRRGDPSDANV